MNGASAPPAAGRSGIACASPEPPRAAVAFGSLVTLVLLFGLQGEQIMRQPIVILLLAVPIIIY